MIYDKEIEISVTEKHPRYDIVDSHLHFLDFTQDSDGFPALTKAMDASGVSREIKIEELLIIAGELLRDNPNLYVDISWVFYENYIRGGLMWADDGTEIYTDMWAALIEKYSDRFMIGSDVVGHWSRYPIEITKYYLILDKLRPETAEKLCRKNIPCTDQAVVISDGA